MSGLREMPRGIFGGDVTFMNEPNLLNDSLKRTVGTELQTRDTRLHFYVTADGSDITNQSVLNGSLKGMDTQHSIGSHNGSHRSHLCQCLSSMRCAIDTEVPTTNGASFLCPRLSCWGLRDVFTPSTAISLRSPTLVLVVHCPAGLICFPVSAHLADLMTL